MEFRCLTRTLLPPRLLLLLPPRAPPLLRHFTHSARLSADPPPLPAAAAPEAPTTEAPPKRDTTMAELLDLAMGGGAPAPKRRDFSSPGSNFSSILPSGFGSTNSPPLGAKPVPRTGPSAGRSVMVISDLPTALARLRGILTANNVKVDQLRQRFHERPGLKKKRLKSLRHRRRFKAGFKKLVGIAMEMKRKGL